MTKLFIEGLVPAVFTPMHDDGTLNLEHVPTLVEHLLEEKVSGLYVCGSTGEGPSLTREERMATAQAYIEAAAGRLQVIVQVGHTSIAEAKLLATHAQAHAADAISAIPPSYYTPRSLDALVASLAEIAKAANGLPYYYYHIPRMTSVETDVVELLERAHARIPNFAGVKYSASTVHDLQACVDFSPRPALEQRFNILFGCDEMLLSGLIGGAHGAVGSTYNFAAPLYRRVIDAFKKGDLAEAQRAQGLAVQMVRVLTAFEPNPAIKTMMKLIGLDCGATRLPQQALSPMEEASLKEKMQAIGFFDWGRS